MAGALAEVAAVFGRLGWVAFGGPAAHIALLEREVVAHRRWMSHAEFLDLLGTANLLPGPNSTELALLVARRRAGWPGLIVGGALFIGPAVLLTLLAAWAYQAHGASPLVQGALRGLQPVALVVVAEAVLRLGRGALVGWPRWLAAGVAASLAAAGAHELAALAAAGIIVLLTAAARRLGPTLPAYAPLGELFVIFLKVGALLYGSGYVLLSFLRADLVARHHWLTDTQLVDAIAVGQATPGPVFSAATFAGYLVAGTAGALVATAGIFLPAFVYAAVSGPVTGWLRATPSASSFLDGVVAGSVGLMVVVLAVLARSADAGPLWVALALAAALLRALGVNPAWLLAGGAALGAAATAIGSH